MRVAVTIRRGRKRTPAPRVRHKDRKGPASRFITSATGETWKKSAAINGDEATQALAETASASPATGTRRRRGHQGRAPARIPKVARNES